jgi:spore germination cell wall hydrolase CwlJ-like protein
MSKKRFALLTASMLFGQMANGMWTEDRHGNTIVAPHKKEVLNEIDVQVIKVEPVKKVKAKSVVVVKTKNGIVKVSDSSIRTDGKPIENQSADDVGCLAYSIYREAGNLPAADQYAVGQVHINRLREGSWGHSLCKVVFAKAQFSWTLEKKLVGWTTKQREKYMNMAKFMLAGVRVKVLDNNSVLWYHANYVNPKWADKSKVVAQAGPHIFYRNIAH